MPDFTNKCVWFWSHHVGNHGLGIIMATQCQSQCNASSGGARAKTLADACAGPNANSSIPIPIPIPLIKPMPMPMPMPMPVTVGSGGAIRCPTFYNSFPLPHFAIDFPPRLALFHVITTPQYAPNKNAGANNHNLLGGNATGLRQHKKTGNNNECFMGDD